MRWLLEACRTIVGDVAVVRVARQSRRAYDPARSEDACAFSTSASRGHDLLKHELYGFATEEIIEITGDNFMRLFTKAARGC